LQQESHVLPWHMAHECINSHVCNVCTQVDELSLVFRLIHWIHDTSIGGYIWELSIAEIVCVSGECSIRVVEVTALL